MTDEVSPAEPTGASDSSYAFQFRKHLIEVRAHLAGLNGDDPPPSFTPPIGYWTPLEKNAFFHALSVHSRLRPDLVAASISTKSVIDVCAYIDSLDEAIARDRRLLLPRSDLPGAMEVSNAWILREEIMSEDISPLDAGWVRDTLLSQREEEVTARKAAPQSEAGATGHGPNNENLETWEHDRRRHWRREDALNMLECHHLKVMERILKDAEGGDVDVEDVHSEDQEPEEPGPLPPPDAEPSDRTAHVSIIHDGLIDPRLLQLSGLPVPDQPFIEDPVPQRHFEALPDVEHSHDTLPAFNTASSPPPPHAPLVVQPLDYPRSPSPDSDRETAIDHSNLSPASRRRVQKRLHMRRKRAAQRGDAVNEATVKLRPGRKAKRQQTLKPRGKQHVAQLEQAQLEEGEGEENALMAVDQNREEAAMSTSLTPPEEAPQQKAEVGDDDERHDSDASRERHRNNSGMTKPYKIKRDFATMGIDADTLIDGNLGHFHLSALSRLMTFYKSGYDIKGSSTATSISADTIRLLSAILVEFVTEAVHRSIISREQENSMKAGIKVYHQTNDDITAENVTHVLEMMGMVGMSKDQYFAQLLGEETPEHEESAEEDDDDAEDATDEIGEDDQGDEDDLPDAERPTLYPMLLPLHREIHPPLVMLPKSLLPRTPARSGPTLAMDDKLIPTEPDNDEVLEELDDEMALDAADQALAYEYEADLWKVFGK
ncbi:hypothetical protein DXG01_002971 [Tephrocybe rancida]|nr:hypothetical protein DXG01_002971 [Tephrocybe rancida]